MEHLQALSEWLGQYGYPVLFVLVFAESAGVPVPGETAVLSAAVLASRPESHLRIEWVIVVAATASILGDNLGFWAGHRWARPRLRAGGRFLFLTQETLKTVEGYFEHYGALTVAIARFVAGLRVVAALAAGTSGMPWGRFLVANAAGAVAWATTMSLLGYFFGQSWELLHKWMGRGAIVIAGCVVIILAVPYLWRRRHRLPSDTWNRLLRARIWEGFVAALLVVVCVMVLVSLAERREEHFRADVEVAEWVATRRTPVLDGLAHAASYLGSLPVTAAVSVAMLAWAWRAGRPWRELAAVAWALVVSEAVGLALLAFIRHKGIEPSRALAWPFGFAGLAPLRAASVFGMAGHLCRRLVPSAGWPVGVAVGCAVLLTGFSVVWTGEQNLSEVLVEFAAGGLILFVGLWWLEGLGPGPAPGARPSEPALSGGEAGRG